MNLKKYVEAIVAPEKDKEALLAPGYAAKTAAELGLKITQLQIEKQGVEIRVQEAGSQYPLDVDNLSDELDQLELLDRRIEQLQDIQKQLFPAS